MSDITKDQVVDWLSSQSVIEISDLVKELEDKWGVSAAAPVAVAAAAPAAAGAGAGGGRAPDGAHAHAAAVAEFTSRHDVSRP